MKYGAYVLASLVGVLSACSPAADPVGRGGFHFKVDNPLSSDLLDQGFNCAVPGVGGIGSPKPENDTARPGPPDLPVAGSDTQPVNMGSKVTDGQKAGTSGSYRVQCTVKGSSTYTVEITDLLGPNTSEFAASTSGETSLRMTGSINAATGEGTGKVYVRTTETNAVSPNTNCTLKVLTDEDDASSFRVKRGSVDMTFVCPDNTPATAQLSRCETRGTITLDDCLEE
jgi:hypothetical protein